MPSLAERLRRYTALARAVVRARRGPFDPFKLTWILTEVCGLRCRTCHLWATSPHEGPTLAQARAVLAANPQLTWLNLSGGDPVERDDAPEIMEAATERLPDLALVDFPTAGQDARATLAALEPLLESDVPRVYVTVSLDGPDATHDSVRGREGAARRARATLTRLRSIRRRGFTAVAGMTLSRHNLPPEPPLEMRALLPDVAPEALHLNLAHASTHYYRTREDPRPPAETALALIDAVQRARGLPTSVLDVVERRYWSIARRFVREGDTGGDCAALRASVFVAADLRVYPCSIFDRPLGSLADVGYALRRLPELDGAASALELVEARECPRCWSPCEAFPSLLLGAGTLR